MGRTLRSYRMMLEHERKRWEMFRKALRGKKEREAFDKLWKNAFRHGDCGTHALRPVIFDTIVFSMLLGLMEEVRELQEKVQTLEKKA